MPYIWTEPEIAIEHNGVTIYHVYKNGFMDSGRYECLYTTDVTENDAAFDIRDLQNYDTQLESIEILKKAIDSGELMPLLNSGETEPDKEAQ